MAQNCALVRIGPVMEEDIVRLTGALPLEGVHQLALCVDTTHSPAAIIGELLPALRELDLTASVLREGLRDLGTCFRRLVHLNVSDCELADLDAVSHFESLEVLKAAGNRISDITPLLQCERLRVLDVSRNRIVSMGAVAHLGSCSCLRELWMLENPVALQRQFGTELLELLPSLMRLDGMLLSPTQSMGVGSTVAFAAAAAGNTLCGSTGAVVPSALASPPRRRSLAALGAALLGGTSVGSSRSGSLLSGPVGIVSDTADMGLGLSSGGSRTTMGGRDNDYQRGLWHSNSLPDDAATACSTNPSSSRGRTCFELERANTWTAAEPAKPHSGRVGQWPLGASSSVTTSTSRPTPATSAALDRTESARAFSSCPSHDPSVASPYSVRWSPPGDCTEEGAASAGDDASIISVLDEGRRLEADVAARRRASLVALGEGSCLGSDSARSPLSSSRLPTTQSECSTLSGVSDGWALTWSDADLVEMLRAKPKSVPQLHSRDSYRRFFCDFPLERLTLLLRKAFSDLPPAEAEEKVLNRLAIVARR